VQSPFDSMIEKGNNIQLKRGARNSKNVLLSRVWICYCLNLMCYITSYGQLKDVENMIIK